MVIYDQNGNPISSGASVVANAPLNLWEAARLNDVSAVLDFLAAGVAVDVKNGSGMTALASAAVYGSLDVARVLVERGADIEEKSNLGRTPLMYAVLNGKVRFVQFLLDRNVNTEAVDALGQTAVTLAKDEHRDIWNMLMEEHERRVRQSIANQQRIIRERARAHYKLKLM